MGFKEQIRLPLTPLRVKHYQTSFKSRDCFPSSDAFCKSRGRQRRSAFNGTVRPAGGAARRAGRGGAGSGRSAAVAEAAAAAMVSSGGGGGGSAADGRERGGPGQSGVRPRAASGARPAGRGVLSPAFLGAAPGVVQPAAGLAGSGEGAAGAGAARCRPVAAAVVCALPSGSRGCSLPGFACPFWPPERSSLPCERCPGSGGRDISFLQKRLMFPRNPRLSWKRLVCCELFPLPS